MPVAPSNQVSAPSGSEDSSSPERSDSELDELHFSKFDTSNLRSQKAETDKKKKDKKSSERDSPASQDKNIKERDSKDSLASLQGLGLDRSTLDRSADIARNSVEDFGRSSASTPFSPSPRTGVQTSPGLRPGATLGINTVNQPLSYTSLAATQNLLPSQSGTRGLQDSLTTQTAPGPTLHRVASEKSWTSGSAMGGDKSARFARLFQRFDHRKQGVLGIQEVYAIFDAVREKDKLPDKVPESFVKQWFDRVAPNGRMDEATYSFLNIILKISKNQSFKC